MPLESSLIEPSRDQPTSLVTDGDVEQTVLRLFSGTASTGLVVTVRGEDTSEAGRSEAFRELLDSLAMYDHRLGTGEDIEIEPPDLASLRRALGVLGEPRLKRRLFDRILRTFGSELLDPISQMLPSKDDGQLLARMSRFRTDVMRSLENLHLSDETRGIVSDDLQKLLTDDYLRMLTEHEEGVQRPLVKELAQEALHLIGATFQRAFAHWQENASQIAESVQRRLGGRLKLRESPVVIRERIVEGLEEFLWVETSTDLTGAMHQLFSQEKYRGIVQTPPPVERDLYGRFARTCWDIIQENC